LLFLINILSKADRSSLPECCSSFSDENGMFFSFGVEEGHELAVAVHVEDAGGGGDDDAAEKVELGGKKECSEAEKSSPIEKDVIFYCLAKQAILSLLSVFELCRTNLTTNPLTHYFIKHCSEVSLTV